MIYLRLICKISALRISPVLYLILYQKSILRIEILYTVSKPLRKIKQLFNYYVMI